MYLPLFETIKIIDGAPQNLRYHQARMERSCKIQFKEVCPHNVSQVLNDIPDTFSRGVVKARFTYGVPDFSLAFEHYTPRKIESLQLVHCNDIDYSLKYTDRSGLANLLLQKNACDDILIIKNGFVTDTSFANIAFSDGQQWFTPSTPLLKGTQREKLLQEGVIREAFITVEQIFDFKSYKLINAMLDFCKQNERVVAIGYGLNG